MIIRTKNNQTDNAPLTYLSSAGTAGQASINVKNNSGFTNQWAAQFGETGEEKSEIKMISAVGTAGTSITTSALLFPHEVDTPIYNIKYDKIIFKVSTAGTAGTATAITNGTISITPDSYYTQFDHTAGSSTYAYKTQYYNSTTAGVSTESDWIVFEGYKNYQLAGIRNRVRNKLVDSSFVTDELIDEYINEWYEKMNNTLIKINKDYTMGYFDLTFNGTTSEMSIPVEDFIQPRRVWICNGTTFNQDLAYKAHYQAINSFQPNETFNETIPNFYFYGNDTIGRNPHTQTVTARVHYYKILSNLVNDTDNLPLPMRNFTTSFVNYALSCCHYKNNDIQEAKEWENKALLDLNMFEKFITPRDKSSQETILIVDDIISDNIDYI